MNITESQFRELVRSEIIRRNKGSLNEGLHSLITQEYGLQWGGSLQNSDTRKTWAKNLGYPEERLASIGTTKGNIAFEKWLRDTYPPGKGDNNKTVKAAVSEPVEQQTKSDTATAGGTVADLVKMITTPGGTLTDGGKLFTVLLDRVGQTGKLYIKAGGTEISLRNVVVPAGGGSFINHVKKLKASDKISSLVSDPQTAWVAVLYACLEASKALPQLSPQLAAMLDAGQWESIQTYLDAVNKLQSLKDIGISFIIKAAEAKKWGKDLEWKRAAKDGPDVFVATADVDIQALSGNKLKGAKPWTIKYYIGQGEKPSINIKSSDGDGKELYMQGDSKSQFDYIVDNIGTYAEVKAKVVEAEGGGDDDGGAQVRDPEVVGGKIDKDKKLVTKLWPVRYDGDGEVAFNIRLPAAYVNAGRKFQSVDRKLGLFDKEVLSKVNAANLAVPDSEKGFTIRWGKYNGMPTDYTSIFKETEVTSIENIEEIRLDVQKLKKISEAESQVKQVYNILVAYKKQLRAQIKNYQSHGSEDWHSTEFAKSMSDSLKVVNNIIKKMEESLWDELKVVLRNGTTRKLYRPHKNALGSSIMKQIDNVMQNLNHEKYETAKYKKGKQTPKRMLQWVDPGNDSNTRYVPPKPANENITRNLLDTIESLILEELSKKKVVSEKVYNRNLTTSIYRVPEPGRGVKLSSMKGSIKKYGVLAVGAAAGYKLGDNKDSRLNPPIVTNHIEVSSDAGGRHDPTDMTRYKMHHGVDIPVSSGTPVYAVGPGTVAEVAGVSSPHTGWGCFVKITHTGLDFTTTRYAHLSSVSVKVGDTIGKERLIGLSGGTKDEPCAGKSTGPHLHFSIDESADRAVYDNFFGQAGRWQSEPGATGWGAEEFEKEYRSSEDWGDSEFEKDP